MKANNSLLRPGIISATDALLLSCSPVKAMHWKQDLEMQSLTGEVSKEIHKYIPVSEVEPHFADYFVWLRSSSSTSIMINNANLILASSYPL